MTTLLDLTEYLSTLDEADQSSATFCLLLQQGYELLRLTDRDVAHEFGVSRPTARRWKSGVAPAPKLRAPVLRWLACRALALRREISFAAQ